jgi:hypothetical protein
MDTIREGGCLCGQVRFRTLGEPTRTYICYCKFCQKLTGSAYNVEPVFPEAQVEFSGGEIRTYEFISPDHGRTLFVQFCPMCGGRVGLRTQRVSGNQCLLAGTFDDPNSFRPNLQIFTDEAPSWIELHRGSDCYKAHAFRFGGGTIEPWKRAAT